MLSMLFLCLAAGCENADEPVHYEQTVSASYEQITPEQAKDIMDTQSDYTVLDVRTEEEFAQGHIRNAVLIPDYEITARAEAELRNKEQLILVYCRSGRRSKLAAQALADMGYTNIKEFGGIIDWKYEIIAE